MAKLRLGRYEAEEGQLPPVCLYCGNRADRFKSKLFSWHPLWSYALLILVFWPLTIVTAIMRRRMRVLVPLCEKHSHSWFWRRLALVVAFAVLLVCTFFAINVLARGTSFPRLAILALLFWLVGPCWLVATLAMRPNTVRPAEITDESILLEGISTRFVEAFWAERNMPAAQMSAARTEAYWPGPDGAEVGTPLGGEK